MTLKQFLDKMHHNYIPIHIFEWDSERGKRNGTRWDVPENNYDFSHIPGKIIDVRLSASHYCWTESQWMLSLLVLQKLFVSMKDMDGDN